MKRLLWLFLLGVIVFAALPSFAQASDTDNIEQPSSQAAKKHRPHRRHHKNHHKGHLTPDRYPQ